MTISQGKNLAGKIVPRPHSFQIVLNFVSSIRSVNTSYFHVKDFLKTLTSEKSEK